MRAFRRLGPVPLMMSLALFLSACAANTLNFVTSRSGYTLVADIAYGDGARRTFDLYVPDSADASTPVVVFIHGGSWDTGSKDIYRFVGQRAASEGFILAVPNYRLYPEVTFPGFVEDGATAVAAVARTVDEGKHGVPAGDHPLALLGHSAGAEIAGLLAFDEHYLADEGFDRDHLSAFVGLAGPYDFLPLTEERYKRIFPEATRAASQPVNFADGDGPPALLVHGLADTTVDPRNTRSMARAIEAAGGSVQARFFEGVDHIGPITSFATALPLGEKAIPDAVFAFLRATMR